MKILIVKIARLIMPTYLLEVKYVIHVIYYIHSTQTQSACYVEMGCLWAMRLAMLEKCQDAFLIVLDQPRDIFAQVEIQLSQQYVYLLKFLNQFQQLRLLLIK